MDSIDKAAVRRSFNRTAQYYDENAHLQRAVANRLIAQAAACVASLSPPPARILDAGAGSGFSTAALADAFPDSRIVALDFAQEMLKAACKKPCGSAHGTTFICGDMETLPFADATFDLVCSSSVLQWSNNLQGTLDEFRRVLKKNSTFLIAIYTDGTLRELEDSWSAIDDHAHILNFPTPRQLCRALETAGIHIMLCQTQHEVVLYDDIDVLLATLKRTGVRNFRRDRHVGLTAPAGLERMKARYRARYATGGLAPASYVITFVAAQLAQP